MQHKSDILNALANPRERLSDLEDAFRALVAWPQEDMIRGMAGTEDAVSLLGTIALALVDIGDMNLMPSDIVETLKHEADRRGWSIVDGTYYAGASYVKLHLDHWHPILRAAKTDEP